MRRDPGYLAALIASVAAMLELKSWMVLPAALGPAWILGRGSVRPMWTAPLAVVGLAVLTSLLLDMLGAECPREGMDYLGECNGVASAGMLVFYGGVIALQVAAVATVGALLLRAGRWVLHRRMHPPEAA
jgi:hypothetical protein